MKLNELHPPAGERKKKKRIGRGEGSGWGETAGKGHKGQNSRAGRKHRAWFEGGQMPLQRRVPKFGFTNIFRVPFQVVNLKNLESLKDEKVINREVLLKAGLIKNNKGPVKILGDGELSFSTEIHSNKFSKTAIEKIEKAGGKAVLL